MGVIFSNRQRAKLYKQKGRPVLALEFDVFPSGEVSMWTHTRHDIPFDEMKRAFEAVQDHLRRFIVDGDICPFNPSFLEEESVLVNDGGKADFD